MDNKLSGKKVIGAKQTIKYIKSGLARVVHVAKDADSRVIKPIIELCQQNNIQLVYHDTMQGLGKLCSIDVGTATACIIDDKNKEI